MSYTQLPLAISQHVIPAQALSAIPRFTPLNAAGTAPHLVGYLLGVFIYGILLVMVWPRGDSASGTRLPLATALLGLAWNTGQFTTQTLSAIGLGEPRHITALIGAAAFAALGFMPAVVARSALAEQLRESGTRGLSAKLLLLFAFGLSTYVGLAQFASAILLGHVPATPAQHLLTPAFGAMVIPLILLTRSEAGWRRTLWVLALSLFAVAGRGLSYHTVSGSWLRELVGHHASLHLAFAILYQDYRFALADRFLRRVLVLLSIAGIVFGGAAILAPLLAALGFAPLSDPRVMGIILALCAVALYPLIRSLSTWFVASIVMRREPHRQVRQEIAALIRSAPNTSTALDAVCARLAAALGSPLVRWAQAEPNDRSVRTEVESMEAPSLEKALLEQALSESRFVLPYARRSGAFVLVATAEPPWCYLTITARSGGRLSVDDLDLLAGVAQNLARRLNELRLGEERYAREMREREISKLATEAELKALRAQINPHFLFNAMTSIGYLIQTSPDRALETLLNLTDLLRRVLRSEGKFTTLGRELEVIQAYLDIERARFEERLEWSIDIPEALRGVTIPPLSVLPLVENSIKHAIARSVTGGRVRIQAQLEPASRDHGSSSMRITVTDSGAGPLSPPLPREWRPGVGLKNLEQRLHGYYGDTAVLQIGSPADGPGTEVSLCIPCGSADQIMARPIPEEMVV